eukprot:CAMPEP_0178715298 /NCGR_PEP_ID=MMETSP0699-20121125/20572_1 /TAXON_ID=265572 /ORGANISM="Extubocellulus spinifer, Strain CCMP396" /LENGTH=98 /DNA_ID=CAMNT_0020364569 /DNA_START=72 /DNA_END=368 /DNA_ORIENTATION=+
MPDTVTSGRRCVILRRTLYGSAAESARNWFHRTMEIIGRKRVEMENARDPAEDGREREACAAKIMRVGKEDGEWNLADPQTKAVNGPKLFKFCTILFR